MPRYFTELERACIWAGALSLFEPEEIFIVRPMVARPPTNTQVAMRMASKKKTTEVTLADGEPKPKQARDDCATV